MARITATEAARSFSDVLNRVARGESIEVTRGGEAIASIERTRDRYVSAQQFRELMAGAPAVDDAFAGDVRELRDAVGAPDDPWPS